MSDPLEEKPARRGFTLLEVLVAVALLGVVVSVLARSAIEGMSYEGDATRRTRASLIADRTLFGVEVGLELGPPQALHEEREEGDFQVTLDVQPWELGPGGLDALLPPVAKGTKAPAAEAAAPPSVAIALFRVLVRVSWIEGLRELSVTRSSFASDASAAAQVLRAEEERKAEEENAAPPPAEAEAEEEEEP